MTTANILPSNTTGVPPVPPEAHQRVGISNQHVFSELLTQALTEPGLISEAYRRFHRFSISNQLLAAIQLRERDMALAPIASFSHWQTLGRKVLRGEKALALFMPVTIRQKVKDEETGEDQPTGKAFTRFVLKRQWFSLNQTEGAEYIEPLAIPEWDAAQALAKLDIQEGRFVMVNGNVQGYALDRTIAINPLAALPHKSRFHELAHVVLGHTTGAGCWDTASVSRRIQEAEAEGAAYLLCTLLDLPGRIEARGYIQSWLNGQELPERSAQRIFSAAQSILAAGKPE